MSAWQSPPPYLALCPHPTEPLCAAELRALPGVESVIEGRGAVAFGGGPAALYQANLHLRSATRVLEQLLDFPCRGPRDLYEGAREIPWERHLHPDGTLAVSAHGQGPGLGNSMFVAQRVKDAAVDRLRERFGRRPDVDPQDPDLRINVQLYETGPAGPRGGDGPEPVVGSPPQRGGGTGTRCTISLDSSSAPLHRRGYRRDGGIAPLKENLAAAILLLAGYAGTPLCDPFCGSGSLLIEGGWMALSRAPGLLRGFGFQRWPGYDAALFARLRAEAEAAVRPIPGVFLHGSDIDAGVLRGAERNTAAAGLTAAARLTRADVEALRAPPGEPGVVVCNPPYGERLGEEEALVPVYRALGDALKRHFTGWTAYVFTANLRLARQVGLRPTARHVLYNGNLEGRLLRFDLY